MRRSAPLSDMRTIKLHGPQDFAGMRRAGHLAAATLDFITPHVRAGVTTEELDRLCERFIRDARRHPRPAQLSRLSEVDLHLGQSRRLSRHPERPEGAAGRRHHQHRCHRHPRRLARRHQPDVPRRRASGVKAQRLIDVTFEAMWAGIARGQAGRHARRHRPCHPDATPRRERFSVVRDFCGHGLGRIFHDAPNILHFGEPGDGPSLREGMFFTIEPMINAGRWEVKILARRLDGGDQGPLALGAVRAFDRRHRRPATRSSPCRRPASTGRPTRSDGRRVTRAARRKEPGAGEEHRRTGHRRAPPAAARALPRRRRRPPFADYELLESCSVPRDRPRST